MAQNNSLIPRSRLGRSKNTGFRFLLLTQIRYCPDRSSQSNVNQGDIKKSPLLLILSGGVCVCVILTFLENQPFVWWLAAVGK